MSASHLEPMTRPRTPAKSRVFIIDLARGLAVFFMICVHTLWMLGSHQLQTETGFGHWVHLMGQGASAFLITMGFSFMVTPDRRLSRAFERGVFILLVAYLMNALKFLVPIYVFGTMPEAFIAAYGWQSPISPGQAAYLLGTGDILQMAGVSLFLIGWARRFVPNKYGILALMLASVGVSALLRGTRVGHPAPDYVLDVLWGTQWNVYFPVFPWIAHILAGMFLGSVYLEHDRDERVLMRAVGGLGLVLLVAGWTVSRNDWAYHFNDFFHTGPGGTLYLIGRALCVFYVAARLLALRPLPAWFRAGVNYLSAHVTTLYVVQWTLICWAMGIVGYQTLGLAQTVALMPVMIVATLIADYAWRHGWQAMRGTLASVVRRRPAAGLDGNA
ncbi:MAG: hypothetical protein AMXMBFR76_14240 [Pseudomonadota bacterium]|jgi:uncharacterized membrane protein